MNVRSCCPWIPNMALPSSALSMHQLYASVGAASHVALQERPGPRPCGPVWFSGSPGGGKSCPLGLLRREEGSLSSTFCRPAPWLVGQLSSEAEEGLWVPVTTPENSGAPDCASAPGGFSCTSELGVFAEPLPGQVASFAFSSSGREKLLLFGGNGA